MSRRTEIPKNYLDPEEATGLPALPISKVRTIVKADDDVHQISKPASFLVTIAAEMFVQHLTEQGLKALASERRPRKTLQYKDLASAVSRIDNLEFLADVIPPVIVNKPTRETKAAKSKKKQDVDNKQLTLTGRRLVSADDPNQADDELEGVEPEDPSETTKSTEVLSSSSGKSKQRADSPSIDSDVNMT